MWHELLGDRTGTIVTPSSTKKSRNVISASCNDSSCLLYDWRQQQCSGETCIMQATETLMIMHQKVWEVIFQSQGLLLGHLINAH